MSPRKEPHFFGFEDRPPDKQGPNDYVNSAITNITDYKQLFTGVTTETAVGEASPTYLQLPRAVERIYYHIPNAKLIVILRQPADRAFSAYMHVVRDQRETAPTFQEGLRREPERIAANWGSLWHYTKAGYYYPQLKRYYDRFDSQQIRVYLHDDFVANPLAIMNDIFDFLEVDTAFVPDMQHKANVSGVQKSKLRYFVTNTLFNKPNPIRYISRHLLPEETRWRFTTDVRNRNLTKRHIPPDIRIKLTAEFRPDILQLEQLINRDLSHWLV